MQSIKIFIDRSDSLFNHCQIINSDEVWEFLKNEGFTKIKSTEISFKNQIGLFNSATTIVGAHGAGLTNMIFSKSNTNIIEFVPENHPNNFFRRVSQINNLNYRKIVSKNLKLNNHDKKGDILVDLKILKESCENLKEFKNKTIV
jgi:capsular polysaccharide biosynthesis protein